MHSIKIDSKGYDKPRDLRWSNYNIMTLIEGIKRRLKRDLKLRHCVGTVANSFALPELNKYQMFC